MLNSDWKGLKVQTARAAILMDGMTRVKCHEMRRELQAAIWHSTEKSANPSHSRSAEIDDKAAHANTLKPWPHGEGQNIRVCRAQKPCHCPLILAMHTHIWQIKLPGLAHTTNATKQVRGHSADGGRQACVENYDGEYM